MTQKHAFIESLWLSLPAIEDSATFYTTWLSQLAASIANVENAVLMLKHADDSTFTPVALWPDPDQDISHLSAAAEAAITQRSALIYRAPETREKAHDTVQVCCPIALDGVILGIVIIDLLPSADKAYCENWAVAHMLSVVLIDQSNLIGVLILERCNPQAFDEETCKSFWQPDSGSF